MKTAEMQLVLDVLTQEWFGRKRSDAMSQNVCVTCGEKAAEFRNEISQREWSISGMCQKCQDDIFGVD